MMKKKEIAIVMGAAVIALSACGQTGEPQKVQTNAAGDPAEMSDGEDQSTEIQNDETPGPADRDPAEAEEEGHSAGTDITKKDEALADADEYEGEYLDYAVDEPGLEIKKNSDGTYRIQILIYRLCFIDDGIGQKTENGLEFTATGPDGNEVHGVIKLEEDIAAVTISGEVWLEFAGTNEFSFYKTSNVPNMYDAAADSDVTAEELLDLFISGSINAVDPEDLTSTFYITDLNMDTEEWDSYSIGEKVDLDNDGEDELVLNGPYGGIYLDARDDKVYVLAAGEGTALILSYTYYNGDIWIMYSNRSSAGFEAYHMEKFEGADHPAAEMNFGEELVDSDDPESETKYTLNGTEISYDEYYALCSKIFAAEVSTES